MSLVSASNSRSIRFFHTKPFSESQVLFPVSINFPLCTDRWCAIKSEADSGGAVRNNWETPPPFEAVASSRGGDDVENDENEKADGSGGTFKEWESLILEETVPFSALVKMILFSGIYENGERLSPEHEKIILEQLLPYHPAFELKIGCGVDYLTIGYHPEFQNSRCLFIVRKDGTMEDFSYWKCIKGLIRKKYPLYADDFMLKHFKLRRDYSNQ